MVSESASSSEESRQPQRRQRRYEGPLNSAIIVDAAIAIAREDGLESMTMRRLATDLRAAPMSIYRHVDDRKSLLLGMLDVVAEGVKPPPISSDPRTEILAVMTAIHDALHADPWAVGLLVYDKLASPKVLPALDRIFTALTNSGLTPPGAAEAYMLIWHYTTGELLDRHHTPVGGFGRSMVRSADPAQYPGLMRVVTGLPDGPPGDHFVENLQRILDGLMTGVSRP